MWGTTGFTPRTSPLHPPGSWNKLFQVIKELLPTAHAYTDDTQLYLSFKPEGNANQEYLGAMESCIKAVRARIS